jgi:hypothetical protein
LSQAFLIPSNAAHRQYEALRAYLVDRVPQAEAAQRFGYTLGSFRVLVHEFRQDPQRQFFLSPQVRRRSEPKDPLREKIVKLRKQNQSVYDISEALKKDGTPRSAVAVGEVLKREGFAKLPRRRDEERPAGTRPTAADRADVRELSLKPRSFRTKYGGLFLFLPALASLGFDQVIRRSELPGTEMIPAAHAVRSLLALKLFCKRRHTHAMSAVLDEGLALRHTIDKIGPQGFVLSENAARPGSSGLQPQLDGLRIVVLGPVVSEAGRHGRLERQTLGR